MSNRLYFLSFSISVVFIFFNYKPAYAGVKCVDLFGHEVLVKSEKPGSLVYDPFGRKSVVFKNNVAPDSPVNIYERTGERRSHRSSIEGLRQMAEPHLVSLFFETKPGQTLLDVGCGDGGLVENLRDSKNPNRIEAVGIDIALRPSQKKKEYFSQRDMRQTGFADQIFDKIIAVMGPFYYPEPPVFRSQGLQEMLRVLKPGGKILFVGFTGYAPNYAELVQQGIGGRGGMAQTRDYYAELMGDTKAFYLEVQRQLDLFPDLKLIGADPEKQTVLFKKIK